MLRIFINTAVGQVIQVASELLAKTICTDFTLESTNIFSKSWPYHEEKNNDFGSETTSRSYRLQDRFYGIQVHFQ